MKRLLSQRWLRYTLGSAILLGLGSVLTWAFIEGREEMRLEREREKPIQVPPRTRIKDGVTYIELDNEAVVFAGVKTETVRGLASMPVSSIVYHEGKSWLYVEVEPGRYTRLPADRKATKNFGGRVVTVGAQILLSEELKSKIQSLGEEIGR